MSPAEPEHREQQRDGQRSPLQQLEEQSLPATSPVPLPAQAPATQLSFPCTLELCALVLKALGRHQSRLGKSYLFALAWRAQVMPTPLAG